MGIIVTTERHRERPPADACPCCPDGYLSARVGYRLCRRCGYRVENPPEYAFVRMPGSRSGICRKPTRQMMRLRERAAALVAAAREVQTGAK